MTPLRSRLKEIKDRALNPTLANLDIIAEVDVPNYYKNWQRLNNVKDSALIAEAKKFFLERKRC